MDDIAVMKVTPPFEFNDVVQPVVLPGLNFVPTGKFSVIKVLRDAQMEIRIFHHPVEP